MVTRAHQVKLQFLLCFFVVGVLNATGDPASQLIAAAKTQIGVTVQYDPSYQRIPYPGGDIPQDRGVCTDVVVRAYRKLGLDLQVLVHQDMLKNPTAYPNTWGTKEPDSNIDHRRVPNLAIFFTRHGKKLPISKEAQIYRPGDIVVWLVPPNLPHIGIISDQKTFDGIPLAIHNIGAGTKMEDVLFVYPITGHYRWFPAGG